MAHGRALSCTAIPDHSHGHLTPVGTQERSPSARRDLTGQWEPLARAAFHRGKEASPTDPTLHLWGSGILRFGLILLITELKTGAGQDQPKSSGRVASWELSAWSCHSPRTYQSPALRWQRSGPVPLLPLLPSPEASHTPPPPPASHPSSGGSLTTHGCQRWDVRGRAAGGGACLRGRVL